MSIHGECFDNGQSGNCGIDTCSMFIRGECHIYQEVVENLGKLSWDDIQEVLAIHYDGFGDNSMQRLTNEIIQTLTEANEKVILLSKMNEVPWESLKQDTLLIASDFIEKVLNGTGYKCYFAKVEGEKIYVYQAGRTSATATPQDIQHYKYAFPI